MLWFRNTWSWKPDAKKPLMREQDGNILVEHGELGEYRLFADSLRNDLPHPGPLPKERENRSAASGKSMRLDLTRDAEREPPLPGGEGRGGRAFTHISFLR